jgi:hypothetical protein
MINPFSQIINIAYAADDVIGTIIVPTGVPSAAADTGGFISALIRFIMVIAGLFTLWQFLSGGLAFITSNGDKGKLTEAQNKIQMSIVGLIIMAASFIIIAIISKVLFGDFNTILAPNLTPIN